MHNAATNRGAIDTNLKMTPLGSREPKKIPAACAAGEGWDGGGNLLTGQKLHEFVEFIQEIVAVFPTAFLQCPLLKTASIMPVVRAIHIGGDSCSFGSESLERPPFGKYRYIGSCKVTFERCQFGTTLPCDILGFTRD